MSKKKFKVVLNYEAKIMHTNSDAAIEEVCETLENGMINEGIRIDNFFDISVQEVDDIQLQQLDESKEDENWETMKRFDSYKEAVEFLTNSINNISSCNDPLFTDKCSYRIIK
ncbi:MAG: hypothetical protein ACOCRX_01530 [Candidatus Woesearchaeota archaeon]